MVSKHPGDGNKQLFASRVTQSVQLGGRARRERPGLKVLEQRGSIGFGHFRTIIWRIHMAGSQAAEFLNQWASSSSSAAGSRLAATTSINDQ